MNRCQNIVLIYIGHVLETIKAWGHLLVDWFVVSPHVHDVKTSNVSFDPGGPVAVVCLIYNSNRLAAAGWCYLISGCKVAWIHVPLFQL